MQAFFFFRLFFAFSFPSPWGRIELESEGLGMLAPEPSCQYSRARTGQGLPGMGLDGVVGMTEVRRGSEGGRGRGEGEW